MKKLILSFLAILTMGMVFSQSTFKIERIDSTNGKTKAQIYSLTKMFIAEYWKSAQNVIQNDDKEAGMILVKGALKENAGGGTYWYSYTVKFLMKEKKYKISIYDVTCTSAGSSTVKWPLIECCVNCEYPGAFNANLTKNAWEKLLNMTKADIMTIADSYETYIKTQNPNDDNW